MRASFAIGLLMVLASISSAQEESRYNILLNQGLYNQKTPKDTVAAVITAIERERIDYLAAHLMPQAEIEARLAKTALYFEKVAAEQLANSAQGANLKGPELQARVKEKAAILNFKNLVDSMSKKLVDEPDTLKMLKRFVREGEFNEAGDETVVVLKDVKDRKIFLKKIDGRWFFENRREEPSKD